MLCSCCHKFLSKTGWNFRARFENLVLPDSMAKGSKSRQYIFIIRHCICLKIGALDNSQQCLKGNFKNQLSGGACCWDGIIGVD